MINRTLNLQKILQSRHTVFLLGPRGVGKTFLCNQFLESCTNFYRIDLLHHDIYLRYLKQPALFRNEIETMLTNKSELTVLIDEVQKLPSILDEVHSLIEKYKKQIQFILTGSSARKLKRGGANLLAGRAWILKLHPLTHLELKLDLSKALTIGTLPAVYLEDSDPQRTLKAYLELYLKEEIMQEALTRKIEGFSRFLDMAGQMNGEPLNFSKLARESNVSTKTAQEYFSILVDTMLAFRIDAWTYSIRKQITAAPKFYFFDCGVLNAVRGELDYELNKNSYRYGKLFETFLAQEIIRINDYRETGYRFYYWRTNTGLEVDLILSKGPREAPIAIEIKSSVAPLEQDLHGLKSFQTENTTARLICLSNTPQAYKLGQIDVLPWQEGIKAIFS